MPTSSQRVTIQCLLCGCLFTAAGVHAAESEAGVEFTPAETEYIALADEFKNKLNDFWVQGRKLTDRQQAIDFYTHHDPATEYLPKLLAFEREHAGEDVGLDALSEVVSYAARGGDQESPGFKSRREVLTRLPAYEDRELATIVIVRLTFGRYDPQVIDYLRRLSESPDANPTLRATARLELAEKLLSLRAVRKASVERLEALDEGLPPRDPEQAADYREFLASLPPADELEPRAEEAIAILEALAATGDSFRQPAYRTIDPTNQLVRIDAEKSKTATPLSAKAAALLFEERHLRSGQPAPELELELIDGRPWSLADQRGRVVVIQFSFTGCGPCEEMYPDLRKMAEEFGDQISIVTIMRDETPDHALAAKESGKITWPIACDGMPGEVCTRWAVDGFPEIYVIDRTGRIAANGPRGEQLRWKVGKLVAATE